MTKTTLHETIKNQIKDALRAGEALRLEVLRSLQSAFSYELIAKKSTDPLLKDEEALAIIKKSVKQHKDSIDQFEKGGRKDLADKEKAELKFLEAYLPESMSKADIKKAAQSKAKKDGVDMKAGDKSKVGKFMGELMKELKGKADGSDVKAVLDEMFKG